MSATELLALQSGQKSPGERAEEATLNHRDERPTPKIPEELSILPTRGFVMFPGTILPITVTRAASIKLLDETLPLTKVIGLLNQRDESIEEPKPQDLYHVGTAALVLKLLRQSDEQIVMIVQGIRRFSMRKIIATEPFLRAEVDLPEPNLPPTTNEWQAEFNNLRDTAVRLLELTPDTPDQASAIIRDIDDPGQLADFLAPNLDIPLAQKQTLLEELDVVKRVRAVQTSISGNSRSR
jgi:ATP-dependent Lon protease